MVDDAPVDGKERGGVTDWFREAWTQAEVEAGKVLHRAGDLAGWGPDEARRMANEYAERLATQRAELDEGLNRALGRVKIPRREEIEALAKRVGRIAQRVEALEKK